MSTIYVVEGSCEYVTGQRKTWILKAFHEEREAVKAVRKAGRYKAAYEFRHYRYYAVELDERT